MTTFDKCFNEIDRLSQLELKPITAVLGKLMEEVGETAECVLIHEGHIIHKQMKEPLVGEIADVIQQAISILVKATPGMTPKARRELLLDTLEKKSQKWRTVQEAELRHKAEMEAPPPPPTALLSKDQFQRHKPCSPAVDIDYRTLKIIGEQLGIHTNSIELDATFVDAYGADSLDLVELCMAIEDEFEMEISDADAEGIFTARQTINYVKMRYGLEPEVNEEVAEEEDSISHQELAAGVPFEEVASRALNRAFGPPDGFSEIPECKQEPYHDPAADYTERTGRHLSLEERMQERSIHDQKKPRSF